MRRSGWRAGEAAYANEDFRFVCSRFIKISIASIISCQEGQSGWVGEEVGSGGEVKFCIVCYCSSKITGHGNSGSVQEARYTESRGGDLVLNPGGHHR